MAVKIIKAVRTLGQASYEGLAFPEAMILIEIKAAFGAAQDKAAQVGGVTTGPAIIKILVEQEVVTND